MGFLDDAKAKAEDFVTDNAGKVEEVSDKVLDAAAGLAKKAGVDADKVDSARQTLDDKIGE